MNEHLLSYETQKVKKGSGYIKWAAENEKNEQKVGIRTCGYDGKRKMSVSTQEKGYLQS
jgi:hypothetical protein